MNYPKPRVFLFTLLSFFILKTEQNYGQDIHFSQFDLAPMNYNPALAGQFDGDYRFILNQRTQWKSVTTPYSTVGGSFDARNFQDIQGLGTGLSIYRDINGDSRLKTVQVNAAGSMIKNLPSDSLQSISAGLHIGITNKRIDYSDLNYDNQYNGVSYDPNLAVGEEFNRDARTYMNLNAGIAHFYKIDERNEITSGISLFNITKPKQSFFNDDEVRLNTRFVVQTNATLKINEDFDAMPSLMFQSQGKLKEFLLGGSVRYVMINTGSLFRTVFGGLYYRTRDAGFLVAGMDYDAWRVGVSYDLNLSDLRPASNGRGGLEISVVYIIRKPNPPSIKYRYCPDYL